MPLEGCWSSARHQQLQLNPNPALSSPCGQCLGKNKKQIASSRLRFSGCKETCHGKRICTNYIKYRIKQCSENNRFGSQKVNVHADSEPLTILNSRAEKCSQDAW